MPVTLSSARFGFILASIFTFNSAAFVTAQDFKPQVKKVEESYSHCSIALNPKIPGNYIVLTDTGTYVSDDYGASWIHASGTSKFTSRRAIADPKGIFYVFGVPDPGPDDGKPRIELMAYQYSKDNGKTWKPLQFIPGSTGQTHELLVPTVHFRTGMLMLSWTETQTTTDGNCSSDVYFNYSSPDGNRWKDPIKLNHVVGSCGDSIITAGGPAVSTEGRVFALWRNKEKIYFDRSYDNAKTWLSNDLVLTKDDKGWLRDVEGAGRVGAELSFMVDNSASFFRSSLYAVWSDMRNGDGDIWMLRSTSRGDLWSQPIRVNQDGPGKEQFRPWMVVDQLTGILYVVYFDRRNHDDSKSDVYLSYTLDGGNHFKELKISDEAVIFSDSHPDISVRGGQIGIVWSGEADSGRAVWTTTFKQSDFIPAADAPKLQQIRK